MAWKRKMNTRKLHAKNHNEGVTMNTNFVQFQNLEPRANFELTMCHEASMLQQFRALQTS
jgi:hypothetical protein